MLEGEAPSNQIRERLASSCPGSATWPMEVMSPGQTKKIAEAYWDAAHRGCEEGYTGGLCTAGLEKLAATFCALFSSVGQVLKAAFFSRISTLVRRTSHLLSSGTICAHQHAKARQQDCMKVALHSNLGERT